MMLARLKIFLHAIIFTIVTLPLFSATPQMPFPQEQDYPYGLRPNNYTQAQMNQHCQDWFDLWRAKYLTQTCGARHKKRESNNMC